MALIHATGLTKSFGERTIFPDVSFDVFERDHIGLVGVNGCGKTTLLNMLTGCEPYDGGQLAVSKGAHIAVLDQSPVWPDGASLYEAALAASARFMRMETELSALAERMERAEHVDDAMLRRQAELTEAYQEQGGLTYKSRTRAALLGLGFTEQELDQPVASMSGGQMRKAELARVLLSDANLLLLDEPTNHLDIRSLEWLEDYLNAFTGAYIVISHDRYFLDHVCTRIFELQNGSMTVSSGTYTQYAERKLSEHEYAMRRYRNGLREIRRIEGVIAQQRRWNQARNYVTIASKEKQIARLKNALVKPEEAPRSIRFSLTADELTCNEVIVCKGLSKRFGDKQLFSNLNMLVKNGEKVCIIGENGCGKTTLLRILLNREQPDEGSYLLGNNVSVGYFEQSTVHTDKTCSILADLQDTFPRCDNVTLRNYLGTFLFRGDDVFKPLNTLSGGELARIQLLKMMLRGNNVLFLDEPTNHLDIPSCEALESALADYGGTMVIITHDRYLANRIADRILIMDKNGLSEFAGDWDYYKTLLAESAEPQEKQKPSEKNEYTRNRERRAALAQARGALSRAETAVASREAEIAKLEEEMCAPALSVDYEAANALYERITTLRAVLDTEYTEWEAAEKVYMELTQEDM